MRKIHFVRAIALIVACGILVAEATGAPGARDARGSHPDSHAFNPAVGASIESEDGRAELGIPPGAFAAGFPIGLTPLPPWALPEPLPLGWSPHYVLRLGPVQHTPRSPLKLRLPAPEREDFVVALLDADSGRWQRVAAQAAEGSLSVQLSHLGTLAVLLPDPGDQTPAIPEDGNPLQGVVATPTPALEKMELSVTPENLFLGNAAEVRVSARVATDSGLPSGSRIAVRILERYDLLDGGHLLPEPRYQELVLYRDHEGLSGNALVFADSALEPGRVRDGRIDVKVVPADALPIRIKAETAGANVTTWGAELQLRSGISAAFAAASPDTEFLPGLEGLEPLADLWLELDAQAVVKPPVLSIPVPAGYPREGTCLVARVSSIQGRSHYQLAGVARPTQGRLVLETGDGAPNWPGIVQGGRYLFLLHKGPMAYVTGQVGRVGNESVEPVLVMAQGLPLVDLVAPGRGDYALALLLSPQRLSATDLGNGAEIGIDVAPDKRDQLLTLDLELAPRGPTLLTSEPVDEASGVSLRPIVKLGFDRSLSQADVTPETVRLLSGNESVGLNLELAADGRSLYLRPNLPLAEKTGYRLELGTGLKDRYGNHLQDAPRQIAFTTLDDTPPPMPEPGQIEVGVLTADRAPVTGGVGATEPGTLVYVKNSGSQQIESVLSGEDGSFSLEIAASLTDDLEMTLRDQAGNEQQMALGRPKPPPGMGVLGAEGGQVTTQEGVRLRFPTDVMPTDSIVHMKSLPTEEFPTPFSSAMPGKVLGAVDLDLGGAEIPGVASLELRVGGLPQFNVSDNIPLFRIEQDLALPMDLKPGQKIKIRLRGQDVAGRLTRLETVLEIVAPEDLDTQQARPRSLEQSGSPTLKMTLPQRAAPGQTVRIAAAADPPYIKLGFPLNGEELTGKEQFLAFEVRNEGEHWFWDLTDIAELRTDADGDRLVETSSPPYRGIRKDRSSLILVMFYQTSVSFMQVMQRTSPTNSYGTIDSLRDLRNGESPFMPMVTIGASRSMAGMRIRLGMRPAATGNVYV